LLGLTGNALTNALDQVSGQPATGAAQAGTQAMNAFLGLTLNPFADNRSNCSGSSFGPAKGSMSTSTPIAQSHLPEGATAAIASLDPNRACGSNYSIWGSAYGGATTINGNATIGSQWANSHTYGFATGADYRVANDVMIGVALAGGGTSWGLGGGLGSGSADMFQAGFYGSKNWGSAYLSGALAYAANWASTNRTITIAGTDILTANFSAHSFGGRIESGNRIALMDYGLTPYAALQVQSFLTPAYGEQAKAGSNAFALSYASQSTTTTRTELGAWVDKGFIASRDAILLLRGRLAWTHDFNNDRNISAAFQSLPGSNFTVGGAKPAPDSALVSAAAEWRLKNGWSFLGKFDGEFSSTTRLFAGTGTLRYPW
jgi:uncharacterized protein with beta-barrel porin domain